MEKRMKKRWLVLLVAAAALLAACNAQEQTPGQAGPEPQSSSQADPAPQPQDEAPYPMQNWSWVDDASAVAIEKDGLIRYVGLDNRVKSTAEIAPQYLPDEYRLIFGSRNFFILHSWNAGNAYTTAYQIDGQWQLYNGSVHRRDGTLLHALSALAWDYDNEPNRLFLDGQPLDTPLEDVVSEIFERADWVDDRHLALVGSRRLFLYDTEENQLTLIDDFSAELPEGKAGAYYGIHEMVPKGEGCLYFVFDIPGNFNLGGHVYYGDKNGSRQDIFEGGTFSRMLGNPIATMMQTFISTSDNQNYQETKLFLSTEGQTFVEIPPVEGWAMFLHAYQTETGPRILFEGQPLPDRADTFYVYDVAEGGGGGLSSYAPQVEGMYQFELITVRGEAGSLEYLFSALNRNDPEQPKSFVYSEKTGTVAELERYIPRMNDPELFASTTHYIDFIPNPFDATHMQVSEIKVK